MTTGKEQARNDLENALTAISGAAKALAAIGYHAGTVDREAVAHLAYGLLDSYRVAQDAFARLFEFDDYSSQNSPKRKPKRRTAAA